MQDLWHRGDYEIFQCLSCKRLFVQPTELVYMDDEAGTVAPSCPFCGNVEDSDTHRHLTMFALVEECTLSTQEIVNNEFFIEKAREFNEGKE